MTHGQSIRRGFLGKLAFGATAFTVAAGALSLGILAANFSLAGPRAAARATPAVSPPPDLPASPKAADVVDAADAFLATLSAEQRATAQIELTPQLAVRWTNFPGGSNVRNGVFYRDLKPEQVAAALKVARVALGEEGFSRYQEVRAADDAFAKGRGGRGPGGPVVEALEGRAAMASSSPTPTRTGASWSRDEAPGFLRDRFAEIDTNKDGFISREEDTAFPRQGGPGGRGGAAQKKGGGPGGGWANFGSMNYMIAFLGQPSKTTPWILQLGGHHLAINIYYKGTTIGRRDPLPRRRAADGMEGTTRQDAMTRSPRWAPPCTACSPPSRPSSRSGRSSRLASTTSMSAPRRTASSPPRVRGCRSPSFPPSS